MPRPYGYAEESPKPTYEELLARIAELEKELSRYRAAEAIHPMHKRRRPEPHGWMAA